MKLIYSAIGGRKVFWGLICILALTAGGFYMSEGNYPTYETGLFAIYASMVLGNVGSKFVLNKNNNSNGSN